MTAPTAFLVDINQNLQPKVTVSVDATSGAPTMQTYDVSGNPVLTPIAGGGGTGTVKSVNAKSPDTNGALTLAANDTGAVANFIPWNLDTGVATPASPGVPFTPASGTFPSGGFTLLLGQTTGSGTQTLDGQTFGKGDLAEFSPAVGTWIKIAAGINNGVPRVSNLTAATAVTGSTSESAQQMLLQLVPNGTTLVAGQKFEVDFYSVLSATNDTTTVKHYVNGVVALSGVTFATATFNAVAYDKVTFIVIDSTHVFMYAEFNTSGTAKVFGYAILTVTAAAGLSLSWTYTNSTTSKTALAVLADARCFQA